MEVLEDPTPKRSFIFGWHVLSLLEIDLYELKKFLYFFIPATEVLANHKNGFTIDGKQRSFSQLSLKRHAMYRDSICL